MRTPRRILWNYNVDRVTQGVCIKAMHDEDNKFGVWVENARGDKWVAYGDGRYRDTPNAANRVIAKGAVQQSMNEVWAAYQTRTIRGDDSEVLRFLPTLITENANPGSSKARRDDTRNWAPFFWGNPQDQYVYQRDSLNDISVRTFDWKMAAGLYATAAAIKASKTWYMPQTQYSSAGYPYPPNEKGPSGEVGWPAQPTTPGAGRVRGATGPDLRNFQPGDWRVDGATGPSGPSGPR